MCGLRCLVRDTFGSTVMRMSLANSCPDIGRYRLTLALSGLPLGSSAAAGSRAIGVDHAVSSVANSVKGFMIVTSMIVISGIGVSVMAVSGLVASERPPMRNFAAVTNRSALTPLPHFKAADTPAVPREAASRRGTPRKAATDAGKICKR